MNPIWNEHQKNLVLAAILCRTIRNPITGDALALQFSTDRRKIADLIETWRDEGIKIGSTKGGLDADGNERPKGYFQAKDPGEMLETVAHMESMARQIWARAQKLKKWGTVPTLWEQDGGLI